MDPADPRLVTGTPEQIDQVRREFRRQQKIQIAMRSGLPEIPRSDLVFHKFGPIEDLASGNFFNAIRGEVTDPRYSSAVGYYVTPDGAPIYVERPVGAPQNRAELEAQQADRARRDAAPKKKPAWAKL